MGDHIKPTNCEQNPPIPNQWQPASVGPERVATFKAMHDNGTLGAYVDHQIERMFADLEPEPTARLWAVVMGDRGWA